MNKLSGDDKEFLLSYIKTGIAEANFNAHRYHSEEYYNKTVQLQRIYNILSFDEDEWNIENGCLKKN
tara:strand:- start:677 stop:877 length:201 start_codon:yes stop_codon:yes gene_type:complete